MYKDEAFYLAESFRRIGVEIIPEDWLENELDDGHWLIPSIVNLAFSCELYLKSLISDGESRARGHDLEELFNELPNDELRDKIQNYPQFKGDITFHKHLSEYKNTFTNWRYIFEHNRPKCTDLIFLDNFCLALHNLAEEETNKFLSAKRQYHQ